MTYTYDKEGKLTKTEDSDGRTTTYEYDKTGNLTTEKTNPTTTTATGENNSPLTGTDKNTTDSGTDTPTTANTDTPTERHYLYDGRDNRTFTMEYTPELQTKPGEGTAGTAEKTDRETTQTGIKNRNTPEQTTQPGTQKETQTETDNTSQRQHPGRHKRPKHPGPGKNSRNKSLPVRDPLPDSRHPPAGTNPV